MKEMQKVVSNIIHDLQILNQKVDAAIWGIKHFVEFCDKEKEFSAWLDERTKKEQNERNKSIKTSNKTDNKSDSKGESVGSVLKS
jgi:hypothetical protein